MVLTRLILGIFVCNTVILCHTYTLQNNNDYTRYNIHSTWFLDIRISTCFSKFHWSNLLSAIILYCYQEYIIYAINGTYYVLLMLLISYLKDQQENMKFAIINCDRI